MNRLSGWQRLWIVAVLVWGVVIYALTEWPQPQLVDAPPGSEGVVSADHAERTRRLVIDRVGFWLMTSAALYAVGHGFVWSRRGFSSDINRLKLK